VFCYNGRRYMADDDFSAAIVGNGPVVVPKSGAEPYLGGSGIPIEDQIKEL